MLSAAAFVVSILAAIWLWRQGKRERAAMLSHRAHLLDEAAKLFPSAQYSLEPDGFPVVVVPRPEGGELVLGLVADTLVTRRLPQLWLKLTLREGEGIRDFSLGALARPAGSEFYAITHDLPDWLPPPKGDVALLVRGKTISPGSEHIAELGSLFADTQLKEAVVTPGGVRIVRQACEGDRGTHLLLRQARFAIQAVPSETILQALRHAEQLSASMRSQAPTLAEAA
ncbi:MAG TPA: hypothetical protein VGN98_16640 [Tianweitania sediminis]|jgi:hypothetical protein|nr:hypothetical protein [Tianweitania sediminis]